METIVDQALGHVFHGNARTVLQYARIHDAFMRHAVMRAGIKDRVNTLQTMRNIIGIEDCSFRRLLQTGPAHHADIHPRNDQNGCAAELRCGNSVFGTGFHMARQIRHQMFRHANRANTRTTAAMRDAEGLVQIHVADVRADIGRPRQTDKRIEVRAVEIDLAAIVMHNLAEGFDAFLEHAIGGRIGNHEGGEIIAMLFRLGLEIINIDVAIRAAIDDDDAHARHGGAGRIGAMRRGRDKADVAMALPPRLMIVADGHKAGIFTLTTGIWLQ